MASKIVHLTSADPIERLALTIAIANAVLPHPEYKGIDCVKGWYEAMPGDPPPTEDRKYTPGFPFRPAPAEKLAALKPLLSKLPPLQVNMTAADIKHFHDMYLKLKDRPTGVPKIYGRDDGADICDKRIYIKDEHDKRLRQLINDGIIRAVTKDSVIVRPGEPGAQFGYIPLTDAIDYLLICDLNPYVDGKQGTHYGKIGSMRAMLTELKLPIPTYRKGEWTKKDVEDLRKIYRSDLFSLAKIGKLFGALTHERIRQKLKEMGEVPFMKRKGKSKGRTPFDPSHLPTNIFENAKKVKGK